MQRRQSLLLVGAVAALAVSCRESSVAPSSASERAQLASSARGLDKGTTTLLAKIEISPEGGTYKVGDFSVVFPAGAVCDPSTTKYGARYWNDDCTALTRSITVNVVAQTHRNRTSIDFQPDLRFRPNAGWVTIQTDAYRNVLTNSGVRTLAATEPSFRYFGILYVPTGGRSRIDEVAATGDRSMITYIDRTTGIVSRRIKHFSGFLVSSGFTCTTANEVETCTPSGLGGLGDPVTGGVGGVSLFSSLADSSSIVVLP
jgi:hypothetical protein